MHKNKTTLMEDGIAFYCKDKYEKEKLKEYLMEERLKIINYYNSILKEDY